MDNRVEHSICRAVRCIILFAITFAITLGILIGLLCISACIPQRAIKDNIYESAVYIQDNESLFHPLIKGAEFTIVDNYADTILLNIMYNIDCSKVFTSLMRSSYYQGDSMNTIESLKASIEDEGIPNVVYDRYWHGMMLFIRTLMVLFNIVGIRICFSVFLWILIIMLCVMLWKRKMYAEIIAFLIGFVCVSGFVVPLCIEYIDTWFIMLIVSILVLKWHNIRPLYIPRLFIISGVCTAFFDFLTTETLTLVIPLVFLICSMERDNSIRNFVCAAKIVISNSVLWGMAYIGTICIKWQAASLIANQNRTTDALLNAESRLNGQIVNLTLEQHVEAVFQNTARLLPFAAAKTYIQVVAPVLIIGFVCFAAFYLYRKEKSKLTTSIILFAIGLIPIARYIILNSHSVIHDFFTYRALLGTIMCIVLGMYYGIHRSKPQ